MNFYYQKRRKPSAKPRQSRPRQVQRPVQDETHEQMIVAEYLDLIGALYCHIPNEGKRSPVTAAILQRMGLKKGAPDLIIFEPRGKYHGLAIEMKAPRGRLSADQRLFLFMLQKRGYATACCHGADEAIKLIRKYMAQPQPAQPKEEQDAQ